MKKRTWSLLLILSLLLTVLPTAALAAEPNSRTYAVGTQEAFAEAITAIASQTEPEAVIELTADINIGSSPLTVQGKKVTITSQGEAVYALSNSSFSMSGDLTLDRIQMSGGDHKNIYACGHTFETTPAFEGYVTGQQTRSIEGVYGGGPKGQDVAEGGTNVILRGKGTYEWAIAGGKDSVVHGDTHILLDSPDVNAGNLTGGGWADETNSGQVHGDTHVTVRQGTARSIVGGGRGNWRNKTDKESARVYGDTWVVTGGGETPAYISTAVDSCAGSEYSTVNNTHFQAKSGTKMAKDWQGGCTIIGGGLNDVVLGTTYVEITGDAVVDTVCGGAVGDNDSRISHTEIRNENNEPYAVHIVYDSSAEDKPNIYAGAPNAGQTNIFGNVLVEVKQGTLTSVNLDDSYTDGDSRSPGAHIAGDATLVVTNGNIGQIMGCAEHYHTKDSQYHSYVVYDGCGTEDVPQLTGFLNMFEQIQLKNKAQVEVDLDKLGYGIQKPFFNVKDLEILEGSSLITRDSNTQVRRNLTMDHGSWRAKGMTWVYEVTNSKNSHLVFEDYAALGYGHQKDEDPSLVTTLTSENDQFVLLENGYVDKIYGNAVLKNSDLTLLSPLNVDGNWEGGDSLLRLPVTTENNYTGEKESPAIPLNINGTAAGNCRVRTVDPDPAKLGETAQMPAVGDNYVTDWQAEGQTNAKFLLENQDALAEGLYLKKVTDPADSSYDMWQVARNEKITVQYQWAGTAPADAKLPETAEVYPGVFTAPQKPVTAEKEYIFSGWYTDQNCETLFVDGTEISQSTTLYGKWVKEEKPIVPPVKPDHKPDYKPDYKPNPKPEKPESHVPQMLNGADHFAYVNGYEDGTVRPNANITRAEVASIFFRLLNEDVRDRNLTKENVFTDSNVGDWYNTAVSTMSSLGILKGRTEETFAPNAPITRAEFAAIAARFDRSGLSGTADFTDVSGHWAEQEIRRATALGWIKGYADGSFHPDAPITRAEAMTIINRVLERLPETEHDLLPGMRTWTDNPAGSWFYLAVQEATNSHTYTHKDRVPHETWNTLTPDPNWSRYE